MKYLHLILTVKQEENHRTNNSENTFIKCFSYQRKEIQN